MEGLAIRKTPSPPVENNDEGPVYPPSGNLPADEIHTDVTKKNTKGHNVYASKLFLLRKRGAAEPYAIRKFTTLENPAHSYTVTKTKREGTMYELIKNKLPNWKEYVMPFLKAETEGPWAYIDFEFVKGMDLIEYVNKYKPSRLERQAILYQIAEALGALVSKGITHGDIKADNIFIREDKKPLLLDFADAKRDSKPDDIERDMDAFKELCLAMDVNADLLNVASARATNSALNAYTELARRLRGGKHIRQGGARKRLTRRKNRRRN